MKRLPRTELRRLDGAAVRAAEHAVAVDHRQRLTRRADPHPPFVQQLDLIRIEQELLGESLTAERREPGGVCWRDAAAPPFIRRRSRGRKSGASLRRRNAVSRSNYQPP